MDKQPGKPTRRQPPRHAKPIFSSRNPAAVLRKKATPTRRVESRDSTRSPSSTPDRSGEQVTSRSRTRSRSPIDTRRQRERISPSSSVDTQPRTPERASLSPAMETRRERRRGRIEDTHQQPAEVATSTPLLDNSIKELQSLRQRIRFGDSVSSIKIRSKGIVYPPVYSKAQRHSEPPAASSSSNASDHSEPMEHEDSDHSEPMDSEHSDNREDTSEPMDSDDSHSPGGDFLYIHNRWYTRDKAVEKMLSVRTDLYQHLVDSDDFQETLKTTNYHSSTKLILKAQKILSNLTLRFREFKAFAQALKEEIHPQIIQSHVTATTNLTKWICLQDNLTDNPTEEGEESEQSDSDDESAHSDHDQESAHSDSDEEEEDNNPDSEGPESDNDDNKVYTVNDTNYTKEEVQDKIRYWSKEFQDNLVHYEEIQDTLNRTKDEIGSSKSNDLCKRATVILDDLDESYKAFRDLKRAFNTNLSPETKRTYFEASSNLSQ